MAKGSKRSKIKAAISPVREKLSGSPSKSPLMVDGSPEDDDLMDELLAQLDSRDKTVQGEAATVITEMQKNRVVNESPLSLVESPSQEKQDSKSRYKARKERKAAEIAASYTATDAEADARLEQEAKQEELAINSVCKDLGLELHEITPDGHCLFSAIADQLSLLSLLPSDANYSTTRHAASQYMLSHPDDFLPFLPSVAGEDGAGSHDDGLMTPEGFARYCDAIANTGQWGGEPEIQALSRAFGVPIHVVQGGMPRVVVHEPGKEPVRSHTPTIISYHRRMYGLGEHYNSLRPKSKGSHLAKGIAAALTRP